MAKDLRRIAKKPPGIVEGWVGYLKKALKIRRMQPYGSEDRFVKTAALIALFGPTGDPKATEAYQSFVYLLFNYARVKAWDQALAKIPPEISSLSRLVKSIQAAGIVFESVERARFNLLLFIQIAVQLPDPRAYVEACKREGHTQIRGAFHPNTLTYIAGRYRGVVGDLASSEYREILSQIDVVT